MNILIKKYVPNLMADWAKVLASSRNGIFLFDRSFVEYHGDRFTDFSTIAYIDEEPVALLPASIDLNNGWATSHAGLTYGGVVLKRDLRGTDAISIINALLDWLKSEGVKQLTVKLLPEIFCTYPSEEVEYAFWRRGFSLVRRDLSSILPLHDSLPFNTLKVRAVKKAKKANLSVKSLSLDSFHALVTDVLRAQHETSPVHSLAELELLAGRFPNRIFVRGAMNGDDLLAGTLVFNYGHIWHTQYLASSDAGRALGALDLVIDSLIDEARVDGVTHLSFGSSTEEAGMVLNQGLIWQKESYGARSITHDFISGFL